MTPPKTTAKQARNNVERHPSSGGTQVTVASAVASEVMVSEVIPPSATDSDKNGAAPSMATVVADVDSEPVGKSSSYDGGSGIACDYSGGLFAISGLCCWPRSIRDVSMVQPIDHGYSRGIMLMVATDQELVVPTKQLMFLAKQQLNVAPEELPLMVGRLVLIVLADRQMTVLANQMLIGLVNQVLMATVKQMLIVLTARNTMLVIIRI